MQSTDIAVVRPARSEDLPRILELFGQLSAGSSRPATQRWTPGGAHAAALAELVDNPHYHLLVLESNGHVQGTCTLYTLPDLDRGASRWAVVEHVVVEETQRRRGFGKRLMQEAMRLAEREGCYKLSLSSGNQRSDTHRFYEQIGFRNSSKGFSFYFNR
jgi:GNAT superfamily N-acetyltransferase